MKIIFNKITLTVFCMITVAVFTFIGCKKTAIDAVATPEELKGYEADIKAQIAKLPEREKLPTQVFNENIPVTTFLADENNNPLPAGTSPNGTAAACNFTTPAYCNLIQYARAYDCNINNGGATDAGYYLQFTYKLSWDNAIYVNTSLGYLKIYDATTNALVVNQTIPYRYIKVVDEGSDPINPGNNIYEVTFSCQAVISTGIVNGGTAYNVFTSALFGTTCNNGTNYLVGSAAVTSSGFTGASGNNPCKRNDKIVFMGLASNGAPNPSYRPSASTSIYPTTGACGYTGTFILPDVVEVGYSTNGGFSWNTTNMTGYLGSNQNYLKYHDPNGNGGITYSSGAVLSSGTYNLVFRYRNWKYTNTANLNTYPIPIPTPPDCSNVGSALSPDGGYSYYHYGNVIIP
jgi:hypothetical protein